MSKIRTVSYGNKTYEVEYMSEREAGLRGKEANHTFQELPLLRKIASMRLEGTYLDIGANVGNHTIFFNWHTPADRIISFEPHPHTYQTLIRNVRRNWCDRVDMKNVALWNETKMLHMDALPHLNAGRAQIVELGGKFAKRKKFPVNGAPLDIFDFQNVTLIKMDVEDAESRVIQGGLKTIRKNLPVIVAEHHSNKHVEECGKLLLKIGYSLSEAKFEPRGETRLWIPPAHS